MIKKTAMLDVVNVIKRKYLQLIKNIFQAILSVIYQKETYEEK